LKDFLLFVLGIVPVLDKAVMTIEGAELVRWFWRTRNETTATLDTDVAW
jgi:hypothetical protein